MESKNIRVTFSHLEDVKLVMVLVSSDADQKYRAYSLLKSMGHRPNSAAMAEARRDNIATLELLLSIGEEFKRLHVDCPCPTTPEEVDQGLTQLRERIEDIKADDASAGPVDNDPQHAMSDLRQFLSDVGLPFPTDDELTGGQLPGTRNARFDGNDGTGLYL